MMVMMMMVMMMIIMMMMNNGYNNDDGGDVNGNGNQSKSHHHPSIHSSINLFIHTWIIFKGGTALSTVYGQIGDECPDISGTD